LFSHIITPEENLNTIGSSCLKENLAIDFHETSHIHLTILSPQDKEIYKSPK